jgi:hypothetical protein
MPVDSEATLAALNAMVARLEAAAPSVVASGALMIQAVGMQNTHVQTGSLRRSWRTLSEGLSASIGPTMIYARRQELGFRGPDSLGRVYTNDPGWPYVRPAFESAQSGPLGQAIVAMATSRFAAVIGG